MAEVGGRVREVAVERRGGAYVVTLDGRTVTVEAIPSGDGRWSLRQPDSGRQHAIIVSAGPEPGTLDVRVRGGRIPVRLRGAGGRVGRGAPEMTGAQRIQAPMPGKVVRVLVAPGETVAARQALVVVEAMKMENELRASRAGVVQEVLAVEGASVEAGAPLVVIA